MGPLGTGVDVRRAGGLLLLAVLLLLPVAPARAAGPGYEVQTAGVALRLTSTQSPAAAVFTAGLVDASVAFVDSTGDPTTAQSRASALYPGDLVANGAQLVCSEFLSCPTTPPDYPLLAQAEWPSSPTATAGPQPADLPVGPLVAAAAQAAATATLPRTASSSSTGALTGLATSPLALSLGGTRTTTDQRPTAAGVVVRTESVLSDVVVGPLRVGALRVADTVTLAAGRKPVDLPTVALSGVTFAGQAATVDDKGVHVAGHDVAYPQQALAAMGLAVHLAGTDVSDTPVAARSTATGLVVTLSQAVSGLPAVPQLPSLDRTYLASATIGSVGIAAASDTALVQAPLQLPTAPLTSAAPRTSAAVTVPSAGSSTEASGGTPGRPATTGGTTTSVVTRALRRALPGPDLSGLALVLLLGALVAFVGGRVVSRESTRRRP